MLGGKGHMHLSFFWESYSWHFIRRLCICICLCLCLCWQCLSHCLRLDSPNTSSVQKKSQVVVHRCDAPDSSWWQFHSILIVCCCSCVFWAFVFSCDAANCVDWKGGSVVTIDTDAAGFGSGRQGEQNTTTDCLPFMHIIVFSWRSWWLEWLSFLSQFIHFCLVLAVPPPSKRSETL